jgi:hypothetical protein
MKYVVKVNEKAVAEFAERVLAEAFINTIDPLKVMDIIIEDKQ